MLAPFQPTILVIDDSPEIINALMSLLVACVGAVSTLGPGQHRVCIFDFGALLSRPTRSSAAH